MGGEQGPDHGGSADFQVYWQRWVMLGYMSLLNLLSDWTCYSVAPISILTQEAFGDIDPERLVVIFLGANAVASASEPAILARLGLRRTVLFGALLLMIGSIVKSGGIPPIIKSDLHKGHDEWRLYLGFFLVGLSQPLYQCTPALLSASWFPEKERTMATGVALNANQLGIGVAFVFGTLLVSDSEDIPNYFGLLSIISTIAFMGTLIQFDDAPPTPPSDTARVMRGSLEVTLPSINTIMESVRGLGGMGNSDIQEAVKANARKSSSSVLETMHEGEASGDQDDGHGNGVGAATGNSTGTEAPSKPEPEPEPEPESEPEPDVDIGSETSAEPDTPMKNKGNEGNEPNADPNYPFAGMPPGAMPPPYGQDPNMPPGAMPPSYGFYPPPYQMPYYDPRFQQQMQMQQMQMHQAFLQQQQQQGQEGQPPPFYPYGHPPMHTPHFYQPYPPPHLQQYENPMLALPAAPGIDEGVEPVVTFTPHHLDIDIRDDQVLLSIRACMARPGFIHSLVSFTVSGIVINTLSTFMDYLVRLNGAPRAYVGIVGGLFQFMIMVSSLIIGSQTDKTRAYYSVTIAMLVLGAFGLAECGVSLDADRGTELRWALVIVAILVGPLQPVSTELGVDVVYPLSENTVLVIQQLFSNLLSALFIPCFKAMKDIGIEVRDSDGTEEFERPEYTFSFYLLIVLHAAATVFFATFNGRYLRYEHELQKQAEEERRKMEIATESQPLLS